jgi:hypothetical protein
MNKQRTQLAILAFLLIFWAVIWHYFIRVHPASPPVVKPVAAKPVAADSLLKTRFRRVRSEMDALYHYRIKPTPFNARWNPFRIPGVSDVAPGNLSAQKATPTEAPQLGIPTPNVAENLLKSAISVARIGGVVTMNGTVQLTVGAQLHKEGDVFTVKVLNPKTQVQSVRIRIKQLSEAAVTLALEDSDVGSAEIRVRLK